MPLLATSSLAFRLGSLAAVVALLGGVYTKGRWDEKDAHRAALNKLMAAHALELQEAARVNAEQGEAVLSEIRGIQNEAREARARLRELQASDGDVCPVSDERQRLLNDALAGPTQRRTSPAKSDTD